MREGALCRSARWSSRILLSRDDMENIPDRENDLGWGKSLG